MATSRPFAYNTGSTISGTEQIGDLAIGVDDIDYDGGVGGVTWWMGPDEDLGYVICRPNVTGNQPNPVGIPAYVGFLRSKFKTEESFVDLVNGVYGQSFTTGDECKTYLNNNGYWTSWINTVPSPTPTNTPTPTPTVTSTNTPTPTITPTNTVTPTPTPTNSTDLNVLFLGDGSVSNIAGYISNYITATGYSITYSAVTMGTTYTGGGNITPDNYDVVVIYTNAGQTGGADLSTALTNYVNSGGSVVSGVFLWNLYASGYNHSGTTAFNVTNTQSNIASPAAFTVSTPSVITNGIGTSFGELVLTNTNPTLSSGASLYASYNSGGVRLLAVKEVGSSKLISVNTSFTTINTSGETLTKLVGNSILYAGGKLIQPTPTPTNTVTPTVTPTNTTTPSPTPTPNIVTSGLIMQLDANETDSYPGSGTTIFDLTGSFNNTLSGGATFTTLNGVKCFDCTTGTESVQVSSTGPSLPTTGYTYVTWARIIPSSTNWRSLLRTNNNVPILVQIGTDDLGYYGSGSILFQDSGYNVTSDEDVWVQYAVVGDSTSSIFYINGTQVGTVAYGAGGDTHFGWGNNQLAGQPFGYLANLYFYNRKLSFSEINQMYDFLSPNFVEPTGL
jgi:hypothetical protein